MAMTTDTPLDGTPRGVRLKQAAITVTAPGWRGKVRLRDNKATATRSGRANITLPQAAFEEAEVDTLAQLEIEATPQRGAAGARGRGEASTNSVLTTIVLQVDGGDPVKVSDEIIPKINEAVRRSLPSVLNNLPEVAADFTGRVEEENAIVAALSREGRSATISALKGLGGVGKTALAVKIAHRLTALFPAAQLLVDLRGTRDPVSSRQAMESVIRRFHPEEKPPDDEAAITEHYRDLLRHNKAILILDNAKDTAQVAPLLPPSPAAAIVTSRQALFLEGARSWHLDDPGTTGEDIRIGPVLHGGRAHRAGRSLSSPSLVAESGGAVPEGPKGPDDRLLYQPRDDGPGAIAARRSAELRCDGGPGTEPSPARDGGQGGDSLLAGVVLLTANGRILKWDTPGRRRASKLPKERQPWPRVTLTTAPMS
jgi:hypothetical protein